jgi:hypothetical protein
MDMRFPPLLWDVRCRALADLARTALGPDYTLRNQASNAVFAGDLRDSNRAIGQLGTVRFPVAVLAAVHVSDVRVLNFGPYITLCPL